MRRSPCPASSLLSDSIEQYRYITSLIVISNIKECIAPASRPRVTPRINDAQSMVRTSVFGVNVMDMRVSESAKKNNVAMENASNHPLLLLRLSLRASCSWITHQGLLIESLYHLLNPRIIDTVTGIATVKMLTNGCNGSDDDCGGNIML
jgi:hypothetical protein